MIQEDNFFADNLRYYRHLKGLSLAEFGELFGLGKSQISLYETGKCYPPMPMARKICKKLEVSLDDLFEKDIRPGQPPDDKLKSLPTEGAKEKNVGASTATESPPPKEDVKAMKRQMLEMMLKLEEMDAAS